MADTSAAAKKAADAAKRAAAAAKKAAAQKKALMAVANVTGSLAALSRGQSYAWDDSGDEKKKMSFGQQDTNDAAGKGVSKPAPVVQDHTNLKDQTISPFKEYNA